MAAIFQIRRGTSNISIADGELYLHKGSGSIQFGSGSTAFNLLPLNAPVNGDIILTGNITASNAYFSGDVAISGNLFLGNASNDTITAGGEFTSNLIPNPTNNFDLGSTTKVWRNVYANSISASNIIGSIGGIDVSLLGTRVNQLAEGTASVNIHTASVNGHITDINIKTGSFETKFSVLQTYTASVNGHITDINLWTASINTNNTSRFQRIEESTSSLNAFSASQNTKSETLRLYTASIDIKFEAVQASTASINLFTASNGNTSLNSYTASNDITNTTQNARLTALETQSGSDVSRLNNIESYTASLKTAIGVSGTNVTIAGNLTVQGTTTAVNSTTVQLGDNIIELNGNGAVNGGIVVKDPTAPNTFTGSLIWDSTNDYWKAGTINNESKILLAGADSVVTSSAQVVGILQSLNVFSSSQESKNVIIASYTSSMNSHTASVNGHIVDINVKTGSFETKFGNIQASTSSLNTFSASTLTRLSRIEESTSSINVYTASINVFTSSQLEKNSTLQIYTASIDSTIVRLRESTASLNLYTQSNDTTNNTQNTRLSRLEESTASINTFSASINGHVTDINSWSASVKGHIVDINAWTGSQKQKDTALENVTSSLNLHTQSLNSYTSSTEVRLDDLEYTASISVGAGLAGEFTKINQATASLQLFTASANTRLDNLEATTSSLNSFSSSINNTIKTKLNTDGVISGSSQVSYVGLSNIPSGIISSSAQIDTLFNIDGLVSGSSQINFTELSGISANIISASTDSNNIDFTITAGSITANLKGGVVSGSSQVSYAGLSNIPAGIISSSAQIDALFNVDGLVSGSSQIDATATTNWSTGIKTQLNSNTVVSSSSQVSYVGLSNIPSGIISSSAQIDTLFNIDGLVSGSSQVNFTQLSAISNGIVSGSSQVTPLLPTGVVSGSIQILGGSNILSGSNQSNITSINQNLGTSTTGVQFASLGIGTAPDATYELKIAGDIAASGDIVAYYTSDNRLKNNIQPIENALDRVNKLGGYTFDWNEELQKARKGHDIGVIAQEVQSIFPEVVVERDNGYLGVDYQKLVPVLIEAIKELSEKIKLLENK